MPLVHRKQRLRDSVCRAIAAPLYLIAYMVRYLWWFFAIGGIGLFALWMSGVEFANFVPGQNAILKIVGAIATGLCIAVLLGAWQHFANGGLMMVWEPSEECVQRAASYAEMIVAQSFDDLYSRFSHLLKQQMSLEQLRDFYTDMANSDSAPHEILEVREVDISPAHMFDSQTDPRVDAVTEVYFAHVAPHTRSRLVLYLNARQNHKVITFEHEMEA